MTKHWLRRIAAGTALGAVLAATALTLKGLDKAVNKSRCGEMPVRRWTRTALQHNLRGKMHFL